jgi:predicted RNA-binding Zn-ribbon protein involved in translation (DUF1610 family)
MKSMRLNHQEKGATAMAEKTHIPVPKDTPAYMCANCGAVALDPKNICKVQGLGRKTDWCGVKGAMPPKSCHTKEHTDRWQCRNCGQTAVNRDLLCEPVRLAMAG